MNIVSRGGPQMMLNRIVKDPVAKVAVPGAMMMAVAAWRYARQSPTVSVKYWQQNFRGLRDSSHARAHISVKHSRVLALKLRSSNLPL